MALQICKAMMVLLTNNHSKNACIKKQIILALNLKVEVDSYCVKAMVYNRACKLLDQKRQI